MERNEFEAIRNAPKQIEADITFSARAPLRPLLVAEEIEIKSATGVRLLLNINYNPEAGGKVFNVRVAGGNAICRLCVDGTRHGDAGRSHKHSMKTPKCPERQLPDGVEPRPELSGRSLKECFEDFCRISNIEHTGAFVEPEQ